MKHLIYIVLTLFLNQCTPPISTIESDELITHSINDILYLAKEKKINLLNRKYIHPEIGFYEIKRIGLSDKAFHWNNIETSESSLGTVYQIITSHTANHDSIAVPYNVSYNCTSLWDKTGLFYSKGSVNPKFLNIISDENITIHSDSSIRVVLTESDMILYLMKINNRYYITIFDRVTTDCSA